MGNQKPPLDVPSPTSDNGGVGMVFPCEFVLKVFGSSSNEFETHILILLRKHIPELSEAAVRKRPSGDGKYIALSITIEAESREKLDAIYQELTSSPHVLMAL